MTDWLMDRLPLVKITNTRSPGCTKRYILRQTLTWSKPALVLESEASTRPSRVAIPKQYVTLPSEVKLPHNTLIARVEFVIHSQQEKIVQIQSDARDSFCISSAPMPRCAKEPCNFMLIRLGYDIQFETVGEVPIVTLLNVHPSRTKDLREPDELSTDPLVKIESYQDTLRQSCLPPARAAGQDPISEFDPD